MVSKSACKPAPPVGSEAAKVKTMGGTALLDWVAIIGFHGAAIHNLNPQDKRWQKKMAAGPVRLGLICG
jgi:hypothetical protein